MTYATLGTATFLLGLACGLGLHRAMMRMVWHAEDLIVEAAVLTGVVALAAFGIMRRLQRES